MKHFIKNSIASLLRSKYVLCLLFLFSLFSAALFASYTNANKSHMQQFNTIMTEGVKPDVAVYQNYDYSFQIVAEKPNASNLSKTKTVLNKLMKVSGLANPTQPTYTFKFSDASTYVKYATANSLKHYPIDPKNLKTRYFDPSDLNFSWTASMAESEINTYIAEKSSLLLSQLHSDTNSSVNGAINKYFKDTFGAEPNGAEPKIQEFRSITINLPETTFEFAQVNKGDQTNKIVYTAGADNLFKNISEFDSFNQCFNTIKSKIDGGESDINVFFPNDNDHIKPTDTQYLSFYRALLANIPPDKLSTLKTALGGLIDYRLSKVIPQDLQTVVNFFQKNFEVYNADNSFILKWIESLGPVSSPQSIVIANPSAFQTVISTANVYHGNYRFSSAAYQEWSDFLNNPDNAGLKYNREKLIQTLQTIKNEYPNSFVNFDQNIFLIVGSGITPNYIFPLSVSGTSFSLDISKTCLTYVSGGGFRTVQDGFLATPITTIDFVKFPDNTSYAQIQNAIDSLNVYAHDYMTLPNMKAAYFLDDASGLNTITATRISFLPSYNSRINSIFLYVCFLVWILIILVSFFIIKTIIDKNQNIISIFNANGFSLAKLIGSFVILVTLPLIIGNFIGFIVGIFTQQIIDNFSENYWVTIDPTLMIDWQSSILAFIFFTAIFVAGSFLIGMLIVRKTLISSLKNADNYKNSRLAMALKKPFFFTSVITRFRISIIFNAFQKMIILIILIMITTATFSFFLSTFGRFDEVRYYAQEENNYSYAVQLQTPTKQSGPIAYTNYFDLGRTADGFKNDANGDLPGWRNLQFNSTSTLNKYQNDIMFLQNSISSKITLNYYFGSEALVGANAWSLAAGMMPTNQLIAANKSYENILEYLHDHAQTSWLQKNKGLSPDSDLAKNYFIKGEKGNYSINTDYAVASILGIQTGISKDFLKFLRDELFAVQPLLANNLNLYNYSISYTTVGLSAKTIGSNKFYDQKTNIYAPPKYAFLKLDAEDGLNIFGIQNNDVENIGYLGPRIVLTDGTQANKRIAQPTPIDNPNNPVYNIIVNNAFATALGLSEGSIFSHSFQNFADKIYAKNKKDDPLGKQIPGVMKYLDDKVTFKVIGISRGANSPKAYINFEDANTILGFSKLIDNNNPNQKPYYYNGFYTSENDNLDFLSHAISLFSASGLYPGVEKFSATNFEAIVANTIKKQPKNSIQYQKLQIALGLENQDLDPSKVNEYINTLKARYDVPYSQMLYNLYSSAAEMQMFSAMATSVNTILMFVISMIVLMTFLILIMVSFLIVNNLKGIGTRMQVIGYTRREVLTSFLAVYVPSFFIGIVLSQPLLATIIKIFCDYIFGLTGIVLTLKTSLVIAALGSLAVFGMLFISFIICYYIYSKINLANAIKGFLNT